MRVPEVGMGLVGLGRVWVGFASLSWVWARVLVAGVLTGFGVSEVGVVVVGGECPLLLVGLDCEHEMRCFARLGR